MVEVIRWRWGRRRGGGGEGWEVVLRPGLLSHDSEQEGEKRRMRGTTGEGDGGTRMQEMLLFVGWLLNVPATC